MTQLKLLVLFAILVSATYSTARARQIWSEDQARASYIGVQSRFHHDLRFAQRSGLSDTDLTGVLVAERRIERARPPSSLPFWSAGLATFYHRQSKRYTSLIRRLRATELWVAQTTRSLALSSLKQLQRAMSQAASLDFDVSAGRAAYRAESSSLGRARLPRDFLAVSSNTLRESNVMEAAATLQRRYVDSLLAASGNSISGVQRIANAERDSAQRQIALLQVLTPRANAYQLELDRLVWLVNTQTSAFRAAVKEAHVRSEVDSIAADYKKTLPVKMIVVSTEDQSASMYESGNSVYTTPVTTGGPELPTDHGIFHIYLKISPFTFHSPWSVDSPYYYPPTPVQFWMPFDGGEGLHDASWRSNFGPGSNRAPTDLGTGRTILGTHGCVNLPYEAAQFVWDWAPVGTTVVVT